MRHWLLLTLAGLLLAAMVLIALPARLLWSVADDHAPQLRITGVSGPWWSGRAAGVTWMNRPRGSLQWRYQPPLALRWRLQQGDRIDLAAKLPLADLSFQNQRLRLVDLHGHLSARQLSPGIPGIRLQGDLQVAIPAVQMQRNRLLHVQGRVTWQAARLAGAVALDLGQVTARFEPRDQHSTIRLENRDSPDIMLRGNGELHAAHYRLQLQLKPHPGRDRLRQALQVLVRPHNDGSFVLELEGVY